MSLEDRREDVVCKGCKTHVSHDKYIDLQYCKNCQARVCRYCGSQNLEYYDDGEGYPLGVDCMDCEEWMDGPII